MTMSTIGKLGWAFVIVLFVVRFDFWNWDDRSLVWGFMPIGLAFQAGISVLAGLGWLLIVKFAWPDAVEAWADEVPDSPETSGADGAEESGS